MATARKRNAQDATRRYDIAPLRRRIKKLEEAVSALQKRLRDMKLGR